MNRLREKLPFILIWVAVCAVLIFVSRDQITSGIGWGPDDQMRQVQLRDWLAGQSWFDTVQYRVGDPDSKPMHWPRWIELPLAFFILILSPIFGTAIAETVAMAIVPLIALGIAMWLVSKITKQVFDQKIAYLAAALTATAVPVIMQLRPMRIDHHGWQIVLALVALWTMFWPDKRKGGLVLGAALALWLSISLEGLPLSVAFIALLAWRWIFSADEGVRLFWALTGFLGSSAVLFLSSQGHFNTALNYCDAISPAHLLACAAGAIVMLPAIKMAPASWIVRLGALAAAGVAALSVLWMTAPQCVGGAFSDLDPLVRDYWLVSVREGLPVWVQPWKTTVTLLGGSIAAGLACLAFILRRRREIDRTNLFPLAYAFVWALIVSLFVQRAASVAAVYALPLMAWAVYQAFAYARGLKSPILRILATASVVFLIMPGPLSIALYNGVTGDGDVDKPKESGLTGAAACDSLQSLERLNALPAVQIIAPFDFGPQILVQTPHSVLATSHHRNDDAMAAQIRIFTTQPSAARALLEDRNIRYIVTCPDEDEFSIYARKHPDGLAAALIAEEKFDWLQSVHLRDSGLQVWRIVPKGLRNGM